MCPILIRGSPKIGGLATLTSKPWVSRPATVSVAGLIKNEFIFPKFVIANRDEQN